MTTKNITFFSPSPQGYCNYNCDKDELLTNQYVGDYKWHSTGNIQKYKGAFFCNNLHGKGTYTHIQSPNNYMYEGLFYANNLEGYATVTYNNCTCFEGLFKNNARLGPGVLTHAQGQQDVGIWEGNCLIRLSTVVLENWVPKLGKTSLGKTNILKFRQVVSLVPVKCMPKMSTIARGTSITFDENKLYNVNIRNPTSTFFNREVYDELYFNQNEQFIEVLENDDLTNSEGFDIQEGTLQETELNESIKAGSVANTDSEMFGYLNNSEGNIEEEEATYAEDKWSPEELELLKIKFTVLDTLGRDVNVTTKKVNITDLLAWNNEDIFIDVLKHTFLHRNNENVVGFDVGKLIEGNRQVFGEPGEIECACIAFLTACSEGIVEQVCALHEDFQLNPDLCDARGNTGIMYAACRDRVAVIRVLVELGGNLDASNDECMTPLGMCLLRYLAILYDVSNWEQAFINPTGTDMFDEQDTWYSPASFSNLIKHSIVNYVAHCNSAYFEDGSVLELFRIATKFYSESDLDRLFAVLNLEKPSPEIQNFQEIYEYSQETKTPYLFDNNYDFTKVQKNEEKEKQLKIIFNTIMLLLHYNADILKCIQPNSALILALYTRNEEILAKVLKAGADPNEQTNFLSPLHLLCTLQLDETWIKFIKTLLENGADPNARTLYDVYPEQSKLIGKVDYEDDEEELGKTPLHILAVRPDYSEHIGNFVKLLIDYRASLSAKFLGHTPLSLAVLKGKTDLVTVLLECGADPNEKLNCKLGTPLTIYTLVRYANVLPPIKTCMIVIEKLMEHFGNVLIPICDYGNAIEFAMNQGVSIKPQKEIVEHLKTIARRTAYLHYQGKALLKLFLMILRREPQTVYFSDIAKLLTMDDALRIIQLLINKNLVELQNDMHYIGLHFLLEYLSKNVSAGPNKSKPSTDIANMLNNLKTSIDSATHKFNSFNEFELHNSEQIYIICYECCFRTKKLLLLCPKCGEIYFCSQECNKLGRVHKLKHPCDLLFYDNIRKSYDSCPANIKKNIEYYLFALAKALYEFEHNSNIYQDLLMEFIVTRGQVMNPFRHSKESEKSDKHYEKSIYPSRTDGIGRFAGKSKTKEDRAVSRELTRKDFRDKKKLSEKNESKIKDLRARESLKQTTRGRKSKEDEGTGYKSKGKHMKEGSVSKGKKTKVSGEKDDFGMHKSTKEGEDITQKGKSKKTKASHDKDDFEQHKKTKDGQDTGSKGKAKKTKTSGDNDDFGPHKKTKEGDDTGFKGKAKKTKTTKTSGDNDDFGPHKKTKESDDTGFKHKGKRMKRSVDKDDYELHNKTKKSDDTGVKKKGKKTKESGDNDDSEQQKKRKEGKSKGKSTKESSDTDDFRQQKKTKKSRDVDHKRKGKNMKEDRDIGVHKKINDTGHKSKSDKTRESNGKIKKDKDASHKSKKIKENDDKNIRTQKKLKKDEETSRKTKGKNKKKDSFNYIGSPKTRKTENKGTKQVQTDYSTTKRILKKPILDTLGVSKKNMVLESRQKLESPSDEDLKLPYQLKKQSFMRFHNFALKMVDLFPELDLLSMMLPFVCFREGQLYYKFKDQNFYHTCMTYSSV